MPAPSLRCSLAVLFLAALYALPASAQTVPQASPRARVDQQIGVTDFSLEYSSPGVKGRKIWGELVPMGKVWRMGANQPTKLTASRAFKLGDKPVPAGSYGLFTIPGEKSWTIIVNADVAAWGSYDPATANDLARIEVTPQTMTEPRERMTFLFVDATDEGAQLVLEWEKLRVRIPISVDTKAQVEESITKALDDAWRPHFVSARYLLDSGGDLNRALDLVGKSIAIKQTWWNHWVKAQILGKQGKKPDALKAAQEAQKLGKGDKVFDTYFATQIDQAMKGWR